MPIVNAKDILIQATEGRYAVGAFNITSLVQMEAVIEAAENCQAPVIIQTSVKPAKFLQADVLVAVYKTLAESASVPICLHLDHCTDVDFCLRCANAGYTNIMIDASKQPFEENIRQTKLVVDFCHQRGDISVEGELGTVSGVEDQIRVAEDEAALCNPVQAVDFIERTGVDLFAPAIGTAHGIYKTKHPKIDFERFGEIASLVNTGRVRTPLVVHGGTGLPEDYVRKLISLGGAKFNVSTELKHALIDATSAYLEAHPGEYEPGKIDQAVKDTTRTIVMRWIDLLGSAQKAL